MTAIASNRRRMTFVSRPRTISCGLGRSKIGAHTDLHKLHPSHSPHIKVLRSFFKSDRSPRSPRFPKNIVNPKAKPPTDVRDKNERKNPQRVKRSLDSGCGDADLPPLAVRRIPRRRSERKLGAQTIREGTVLAVAGFLIRLF